MGNKLSFPVNNGGKNIENGMTLRDYFAAKALNGLLSAWGTHDVTDYDEIAHDAYMAADAMMKARIE